MAKKEYEPVKLESYFNNYDDYDDDTTEVKVIEETDNTTKNDYDEITNNYEDFNKINEEVVVEDEAKTTKAIKTTNYSKVQKHKSYTEVYKELDEVDDEYEFARFNGILSIISKGFSILGIIIAIILITYFIVTGQFQNLIIYILGLVVAFFFGWFFMYFLVMFTENN